MFGKLHFSASHPSLTIPNHLARLKIHIHFEHTRIKCEIIITDLLTFYFNKYLHFLEDSSSSVFIDATGYILYDRQHESK